MADGLRLVAAVDIGPHSHGGIDYAGPVVVMEFPRLRHPVTGSESWWFGYGRRVRRPSRGWRRHVRRMKARHG